MGNPAQVTTAQTIATAWGNDVVSRVVGIYTSIAAAETDGRAETGAVITLTDGSIWMYWGTTWRRVSPQRKGAAFSEYELTSTSIQQIFPSAVLITSMGDGALATIEGIATCQITVAVAAEVEIRMALSRSGESTWSTGAWHKADLGVGDHQMAVIHFLQGDLTGDVYLRLDVRASPMATTGDVKVSGRWQAVVQDVVYGG